MRVSFVALMVSGLLNLTALVMLINNYNKLQANQLLMIVLLFSIAVSLHGLFHAYAEIYLDFNPLAGKMVPRNNN
jgi:hypothetical protein